MRISERHDLAGSSKCLSVWLGDGTEELANLYAAAGISWGKRVITYCGRGYAAACGFLALKLLGHEDVRLYDGGWTEWSADRSLPAEISPE